MRVLLLATAMLVSLLLNTIPASAQSKPAWLGAYATTEELVKHLPEKRPDLRGAILLPPKATGDETRDDPSHLIWSKIIRIPSEKGAYDQPVEYHLDYWKRKAPVPGLYFFWSSEFWVMKKAIKSPIADTTQ